MVQRAGETGLLLEALKALGVERSPIGDDLERDLTTQSCVTGAIHLAHSPRAEDGDHFVGTDSRSSSQPHAPASVAATSIQRGASSPIGTTTEADRGWANLGDGPRSRSPDSGAS